MYVLPFAGRILPHNDVIPSFGKHLTARIRLGQEERSWEDVEVPLLQVPVASEPHMKPLAPLVVEADSPLLSSEPTALMLGFLVDTLFIDANNTLILQAANPMIG